MPKQFFTSSGSPVPFAILKADSLRDNLEGLEIKITISSNGRFIADFIGDASWLEANKKHFLREACAYVRDDVIAKHWWHDLTGPSGEEISAYR